MSNRCSFNFWNRPDFLAGLLVCFAMGLSLGVSGLSAQTLQGGASPENTTPSALAVTPKRQFSIVPRVSVAETMTDNVNLVGAGPRADQVTTIGVGLRVNSEGRRVKGFMDYSLQGNLYAQGVGPQTVQNFLNSSVNIEAVERFAFVDLTSTISQQAISAVGTQSPGATSVNANQTETRNFRISPYVRGRVSDVAEYEARFGLASTRSQSSAVSDVNTSDWLVKIASQQSRSALGWTLNTSSQNIGYSAGRATTSGNLSFGLTYIVQPQLNFFVEAGQEANNYTTVDSQTYASNGIGVNWVPSTFTKVSASRRTHSYGLSNALSIDHSTARTAWRYSDSREVTATPNQSGVTSLGSNYDLYFQQYASVEPDPIKRAAVVTSFLQATGINPNGQTLSNFLASSISLQRRQDLTISLLGLRDTLTVVANRTETSSLETVTTVVGDLANGSVITQSGLSVSLAHRLTPNSAVNVFASAQQSSRSGIAQETMTRSVNFNLSSRLSTRTTAILGARRVMFDSLVAPYTETAITGTLSVQF